MPINSLSKFEKLPDSNQSTAFKLDTQLFFWLNPEHDSWKKDWTSGLTNRKKLFELPILLLLLSLSSFRSICNTTTPK